MIWLKRIGIGLLVVLFLAVAGFAALGFLPVAEDPVVDPREGGAGASSVEPAWSGLQREFPEIEWPEGSPNRPAAIELGRLLFFDPVLSANRGMSCATCHHPDLGFADGKVHPVGVGGKILPRHTPSLWNVAWAKSLFWDGRAETLEDQAGAPMTHPDEMANTPEQIEADLRAIPEYVAMFDAAFPEEGADAVTFANVTRALAAFQRTLVSRNSAFDRFAAGDLNALTPSQKRGLDLFRSAATRCFECHPAPLFTNNTFRAVGVPEEEGVLDPGRHGIAGDAPEGAFRVPTLRNVALTAPYMHNGAFATLGEVIDFYARGGGRPEGRNTDFFVQGFDLSQQERADLVAFLHALTDESKRPPIPERVPSGLPVVERIDNPARQQVAATNRPSRFLEDRPPQTFRVQPGDNIQAVVDETRPGDTLEIAYGVYRQNVVVDIGDFTIVGIPNQAGEWPVLDGEGALADGLILSGNNTTVEKLHIRNYTGNGLLAEGVRNLTVGDLFVENTGVYGVYPVHSSGVLLERIEATGVNDAGIYVGQSEDIVIRDSVAYGNVIGIEVENSVNAEVYNNHAYDNSAGIFFDLLPNLTSKVAVGGKVYNNRVENNNHVNFAEPDMTAALIPSGTGVLLLAVDAVEVYDNEIVGNNSAGVAVYRLTVAFDPDTIDVADRPERNWVHDNALEGNGQAPDPSLAELGIPGADILWDGSAWSNRFDQPGVSVFPPLLPSSGWPQWVRKAYWQVLNFAVQRLM